MKSKKILLVFLVIVALVNVAGLSVASAYSIEGLSEIWFTGSDYDDYQTTSTGWTSSDVSCDFIYLRLTTYKNIVLVDEPYYFEYDSNFVFGYDNYPGQDFAIWEIFGTHTGNYNNQFKDTYTYNSEVTWFD